MQVIRGATAPSQKGTTFTGDVTLTRLLAGAAGAITVSSVRFEDGARTNWHEHPGEQVLYVLEGEARAGTAEEHVLAAPGDIIHLPANQRHWHGAVEGGSMTHLSITTAGPPTWYEAPED
jgi:quercetin dioxygenase-like cupin family protein